jgi:hypothetical protein
MIAGIEFPSVFRAIGPFAAAGESANKNQVLNKISFQYQIAPPALNFAMKAH